ncbi:MULTISPECIES: YciI family protein [Micrococcales]|uniref:YciI family protein n=1 Tax=Micrococcales TaxID=85006 RepID=UPI0004AAC2BF|nr:MULTISPECIES: YciI family protein [Micrococcales]
MTRFAVHYSYGPAEQQAQHRPEHRAYLSSLLEQGALLASGPYTDGISEGALLIFEAEDSSAVQALLDQDPMMVNGVVKSHQIREWNLVLGSVGP